MRTKRLLIVDNSLHPILFRPWRSWKRFVGNVPYDVVNVPSGRPVPPLERYTHLLLTGSEASIVAPKPWFDLEATLIRDAADAGLPILASCFGHQMLAYALSGPATVRRTPSPEVGWVTLHVTRRDELFVDAPDEWPAFAYHFDEVFDLPEPWHVLAHTDRCAVQIMRFGDRPIWGIQAHPEMSHKKAQAVTRIYLLLRGKAARRVITALRRPSLDEGPIRTVVRRFLTTDPTNPPVDSAGR